MGKFDFGGPSSVAVAVSEETQDEEREEKVSVFVEFLLGGIWKLKLTLRKRGD